MTPREDSRETRPGSRLVPRETAPPAASEVFGPQLALADRYVGHLASTGVEWGLIGPRELPIVWTRHVLNCAVVGELIPTGASVIDIGSGAGLPGLVLAITRPDLQMTLVEPLERRATWLTDVARDLGLDVRVVRARAEELVGAESAEVVTARAVAPLERLARWGMPLTRPRGVMLAIKGRTAQNEIDAAGDALRRLGAEQVDIVTCGSDVLDQATTVVRVRVGAGGAPRRPTPGRPGRDEGRRTSRRR